MGQESNEVVRVRRGGERFNYKRLVEGDDRDSRKGVCVKRKMVKGAVVACPFHRFSFCPSRRRVHSGRESPPRWRQAAKSRRFRAGGWRGRRCSSKINLPESSPHLAFDDNISYYRPLFQLRRMAMRFVPRERASNVLPSLPCECESGRWGVVGRGDR